MAETGVALISTLLAFLAQWLGGPRMATAFAQALQLVEQVGTEFPTGQEINRRVAAAARLMDAVPGVTEHQANLLVELALVAQKFPDQLAIIANAAQAPGSQEIQPPAPMPDAQPMGQPKPISAVPAEDQTATPVPQADSASDADSAPDAEGPTPPTGEPAPADDSAPAGEPLVF